MSQKPLVALEDPKDFVGILNEHELVAFSGLALRPQTDISIFGEWVDVKHEDFVKILLEIVDTTTGNSYSVAFNTLIPVNMLATNIVIPAISHVLPKDLLEDLQVGVISCVLLHTLTDPVEFVRNGETVVISAPFGTMVLGARVPLRALLDHFDIVEA